MTVSIVILKSQEVTEGSGEVGEAARRLVTTAIGNINPHPSFTA
jgi:hypothetical protein